MDELLKEADNIKIRNLTNKEKMENEESEREVIDNRSSERSVHEKGLWVDKYAPKMFAQLLSPEKTNREVLKALKSWDNYVFQSRTHKASHDTPHSKSKWNNELDNGFGGTPKSVEIRNSVKGGKEDVEETNVTSTSNKEVNTQMIDCSW